ncbi:MAG TPA: CDP-alcohol phosphatidyltransferase family protein [Patescibacteria group bacterium]
MNSSLKGNLPNFLTLSRGILVILIAILFFSDLPAKFIIIYILFLLASLSDYLDGKLARKWMVKSNFGVVFDSLFDKVFTFVMYILLIPYSLLHIGVYIALVFRDLLVDGIKNFSLSKGQPISPKMSGKLKMVFQTLLINFGLLLLIFPNNGVLKLLLIISATAALIFSYYSGLLYVYDWINPPKTKNKKK